MASIHVSDEFSKDRLIQVVLAYHRSRNAYLFPTIGQSDKVWKDPRLPRLQSDGGAEILQSFTGRPKNSGC